MLGKAIATLDNMFHVQTEWLWVGVVALGSGERLSILNEI